MEQLVLRLVVNRQTKSVGSETESAHKSSHAARSEADVNADQAKSKIESDFERSQGGGDESHHEKSVSKSQAHSKEVESESDQAKSKP